MVPGKSFKKRSNQDTDEASKWFVGSSRSNISGLEKSKRHSATRRRSPPESLDTSASQAGRFNAAALDPSGW